MTVEETTTLIPIGQVVAELNALHPDVSHSSLRFLEREGLVTPTRTAGGHRLYARGDVDRIRQIKTWQAQRLSLDEIRQRLNALPSIDDSRDVSDRFLTAALNGDYTSALQTVMNADELGVPLVKLFQDILQPALHELGTRWERGDVPVGQEKETSEIARDLISALSRLHAASQPRGPIVVAACVEGEFHELGLRMVVGILRERGWRVHYLGANVSPAFLLQSVILREPDFVLLSATSDARLPAMEEVISLLHSTIPPDCLPVIALGGQAVNQLAGTLATLGVIPAPNGPIDAVLKVLPAGVHAFR